MLKPGFLREIFFEVLPKYGLSDVVWYYLDWRRKVPAMHARAHMAIR
jgi:hypothetical protein